MNHGYPTDWPTVTQAQFERAMQAFDYAREGWSDCIVYRDRTGQFKAELGYEIDGAYSPELSASAGCFKRYLPTYRLHPLLASEVVPCC